MPCKVFKVQMTSTCSVCSQQTMSTLSHDHRLQLPLAGKLLVALQIEEDDYDMEDDVAAVSAAVSAAALPAPQLPAASTAAAVLQTPASLPAAATAIAAAVLPTLGPPLSGLAAVPVKHRPRSC